MDLYLQDNRSNYTRLNPLTLRACCPRSILLPELLHHMAIINTNFTLETYLYPRAHNHSKRSRRGQLSCDESLVVARLATRTAAAVKPTIVIQWDRTRSENRASGDHLSRHLQFRKAERSNNHNGGDSNSVNRKSVIGGWGYGRPANENQGLAPASRKAVPHTIPQSLDMQLRQANLAAMRTRD